MKLRAFFFLVTFLAGGAAGYYAGQEPAKREAKRLFTEAAIRVEESVESVLGKLPQVAAKRRASSGVTNNTPVANEPAASVDRGLPPADYIRQFLEVTELKARHETAAGGATTVISGVVRNKGPRALRQADVTAYFIGAEGILMDVRQPILRDTPLRAEGSAEFKIQVANVPANWTGGRIRASITEIVFAD